MELDEGKKENPKARVSLMKLQLKHFYISLQKHGMKKSHCPEFHPVCKPNVFRKEWTEAERLEMEILTNSPLVAAFFATTEYDGVEAAWGTEGIWD